VYRVLDDHRRSILYHPEPAKPSGSSSVAASANRYDHDNDNYNNLNMVDISIVHNSNELLCDDVLPYGWYRFLAYGMYVTIFTRVYT
jgi:hypothetical protein